MTRDEMEKELSDLRAKSASGEGGHVPRIEELERKLADPPEEALYLVAVRTPVEEGGAQHTRTMQAIEQALDASIPLKADGTAVGATVTLCSALTANHHGYLREFGFDFGTANQLITVATATGEGEL